MGVPVTFLSANSRSLLGNAVSGLVPNESYLVVPWSEVSASLATNSPAPNTLEDWIAAITYSLVDHLWRTPIPRLEQKLQDIDGTITYQWTQLNGSSLTIDDPASATPEVTTTAYGAQTATLRLTVTDDDGATDTDDVVVALDGGEAPATEDPNARNDAAAAASTQWRSWP